MTRQQLTWVGSNVGDYTIDALLGGGAFSWVYSGVHRDGVTRKAFKVAKPADMVGGGDIVTGCVPTKAIIQMTGAIAEIEPDTDDLTKRQAEKLRAVEAPGLPQVEELFSETGLTWYRMELIPGETLRKQMDAGKPVSIETLLSLLRTLNRLAADPAFEYHGDLKPENVIVSGENVTVLDPGYFGPLRNSKGTTTRSAVTTPAYYPTLMPDDLFALGLMMWEIATGERPLGRSEYASQIDTSDVHRELLDLVRAEEMTGKAYFSPIMKLRPISRSHPNVSADLDKFLMKAVRLEVRSDGKLAPAEGFRSISALSGALLQLQSKGIQYLSPGT